MPEENRGPWSKKFENLWYNGPKTVLVVVVPQIFCWKFGF